MCESGYLNCSVHLSQFAEPDQLVYQLAYQVLYD